jgi:hypothetical protein
MLLGKVLKSTWSLHLYLYGENVGLTYLCYPFQVSVLVRVLFLAVG